MEKKKNKLVKKQNRMGICFVKQEKDSKQENKSLKGSFKNFGEWWISEIGGFSKRVSWKKVGEFSGPYNG